MQLHLTEPAIQPPLRMMEESKANCASQPASHDLGRIVLFSFLLTFILAPAVVFLIMSRRLFFSLSRLQDVALQASSCKRSQTHVVQSASARRGIL